MDAISSYKAFLMNRSGDSGSWTKLVDIKSTPDLGGAPENLETTTLSDKMQTYIAGIQSLDALEFTTNYNKTDYDAVKTHEGKKEQYAVWFGGTENSDGTVTPTGDNGKFKWDGELSVYVNGADVNAVVEMTITIAPSTPIREDTDTTVPA